MVKTSVIIFFVALGSYCFISLNSSVADYLVDTIFKSLLEGLSLSLMAACIFYAFIDFLPRMRRKKIAESLLIKQASVVLTTYKESKTFGHEMSAKNVSDEFNELWTEEQIIVLKEAKKSRIKQLNLQLKLAVDAAHSQLNEAAYLMLIAANISEEHAEKWLNLYTKLRLLAEEYEGHKFDPLIHTNYYDDRGKICFKERDGKQGFSFFIFESRQLRMIEYCEAYLELLRFIKKTDYKVRCGGVVGLWDNSNPSQEGSVNDYRNIN